MTLEQTLESIRAIQDSGFNAAAAVAEKTPGVPSFVLSPATRGSDICVRSYFALAQGVLDAERHTAEQVLSLGKTLLSPRPRGDQEVPLQAV